MMFKGKIDPLIFKSENDTRFLDRNSFKKKPQLKHQLSVFCFVFHYFVSQFTNLHFKYINLLTLEPT